MPTLDAISGAEPSTITFKARTVTQDQNSTVMHQEVITLGGTESTLALAAVLDGAPASTAWGLVTRPVGYSTIVSVAAMPANSSVVAVGSFAAGLISSAAPAAGSSGLVVWPVGYSTIVTVAALPANSSQVEVRALPADSSQVAVTALPAGMVSTAAPAAGDTGLLVRQIGYSTIVSVAAMPANSSVVAVGSFAAGLISSAAPAAGSSGLIVWPVGYSTIVSVAAMPAGSTTVTIAAGNSSVLFTPASTVARASVAQSSVSVTLQSSNGTRRGWSVVNNPNNGASLYVAFGGGAASTTDFDVIVRSGGYYEMPQPMLTCAITGYWDSTGAGFARVCEWKP